MAGFEYLHKAIARSAFSTFPSARNGGELEGGAKSGRLKCHFKMEGDLDLQGIFKLVPIPKKKAPNKNIIVMKNKNEKGAKVGKIWVDDEILHLIAIRREMELECAKKKNKKTHKITY
jgi:hypothetical protein